MTYLTPHVEARPYADVLRRIGTLAADLGIEAYAVGGLVRDLLLERPTSDLDFVTVGPDTALRLAEAVAADAGGVTAHVYPRFGTAAVRLPGRGGGEDEGALVLEFVTARQESYRSDSRKPDVTPGTLEDDQRRRDFTVNALALDLHPDRFAALLDPFAGVQALARKTLDTPLDPEATFEDDPLRMIRAARFAAQLAFRVADRVYDAMSAKAHRVAILSQERITGELQKIVVADVPSVGFKLLESTGLLARVFPALTDLKGVDVVRGERHKDNFYHTLGVLDNLAERTAERPGAATRWLRWAALLHDVGKPATKRFDKQHGWTFHGHEDVGARMIPGVFRDLKLPLDDRLDYVQKLVRLHHRPVALVDDDVTDSAVRRLLFDAGDDVDDLMTLVRSDITSKNPRRVRRYLAAFDRVEAKMAAVEAKDRLRHFEPPVDGYEVMDVLGVDEGVAVGVAKENIREAILDGRIPNEHDAAYAYLLEIKDEALRRGALFETMLRRLDGPERAAMGAVKEALFFDPDVPTGRDDALAYLDEVKRAALAERAAEREGRAA